MLTSHYFDHASTSFPKAPGVAERVYENLQAPAANPGRGDYESSWNATEMVYNVRQKLSDFLGEGDPSHVIFTRCITESLNCVLLGLLTPGDVVVTTSMEHNAVARPLTLLEERDVQVRKARCNPDGTLNEKNFIDCLAGPVRAVVALHASNVCGTVLPHAAMAEKAHQAGALFIADTAQTAGHIPAGMCNTGVDIVCFTGHKGLLGPQGTGGFVLNDRAAEQITPVVTGGTGTHSHSTHMPATYPERLEAGTLNVCGIAGLSAALDWIVPHQSELFAHEQACTQRLLEGVSPLVAGGKVGIVGLPSCKGRVGVVSLTTPGRDPAEVAHQLEVRYGIQARVGLHCAPWAHQTLATYPTGTLRLSIGWKTTQKEVDYATSSLCELLNTTP